jgi:hypothetical protein
LPPGLGRAFWLAALLLAGAESALHSEAIMHRYRAVFAVGRALDKVHFVEHSPPQLLFLGNSRTDNSIASPTIERQFKWPPHSVFNLGLPGANAQIYHGLTMRLLHDGAFGRNGIHTLLLGLDESALQEGDALGYSPYFADPSALWAHARYAEWFGQIVRLWSYSANLRELREPEKSSRLIAATLHDMAPIGGAAAQYDGYRAGFGAAQNNAQVQSQEYDARLPPSPAMLDYLWRVIDALQQHHVQVILFVPPLRDRESAFFDSTADAAPYRALLQQLRARGIPVLHAGAPRFEADEFINAGHLNDRGAQPYSRWIGEQLERAGVNRR